MVQLTGLASHLVVIAHKFNFYNYIIGKAVIQRHKQRIPLQTVLFLNLVAMSRLVKL